MTMSEVKSMIDRVFNANGIYDFYDGKYSNADEWIKGEGIDDVSFYVENIDTKKIQELTDGRRVQYPESIMPVYVNNISQEKQKIKFKEIRKEIEEKTTSENQIIQQTITI